MSNTILEMIRSKHEETEHLEKALSKALAYKDNNPKDKVTADLMIRKLIDQIQKISKELIDLSQDKDGLKKEEIDILAGSKNYLESNLNLLTSAQHSTTARPADVWYNFYQKIKEIKYLNKRDLSTSEVNENLNYEKIFNLTLDEVNSKSIFTSEENKGRCIDLHDIFLKFLNLKKIREAKIFTTDDYLTFLSDYDKFDKVPIHLKKDSKYKDYILSLLNYFQNFFRKTNPLIDYNEVQNTIDDNFEKEWKEGSLSGWEKIIKNLRISIFSNSDECNGENINQNKDINGNHQSDSLFCIPCGRRYATESVFEHHKSGKTHQKKVKILSENFSSENVINQTLQDQLSNYDMKEEEVCREIAYYEYQIHCYKELLGDVFENTKNMIRKKQSMNYDEMEADIVEEKQTQIIEDDEEDDKPIYNPKNVPIGFDGKPIPYWLYKLHGLGVEYKCEICGGASYWGRKVFERHFQEWRHTYGMKCLKIPNTVHFKEVTSIEDALRLHQKLIENSKRGVFKPEAEEEFEDADGNVMSRKMFLDLKRQGLIN